MKRFPLYILLASSLLSSCAKELDQRPATSITSDEAIRSLTDLEKAVGGVYAPLTDRRHSYSSEVALYADGRGGDISIASTAYNQSLAIHQLQTDQTSGFSDGTYRTFTEVLGRANDILSKAPQVESTLETEDEQTAYRDLIGQLYALRGLAHLELARIFCYLPTSGVNVDAPYSGIPLNVRVYEPGHKFQRSTLKETYEQIFQDFKQALTTLGKEKTPESGTINYWAAAALLSRAYLYYGDWQQAYTYAVEVIDQSPYRLYTRDQYTSVWDKTGTSESLFENLTSEKKNTGLTSLGNYTRPNGYPEFAASDAFAQWVLNGHEGDIRQQTIRQLDSRQQNRAYYTTKYPGQATATNKVAVNNFKVIRLSEVYLIAAEAQLNGAPVSNGHTAVELYNALRSQRISPYTPATSVSLDNILDERRLVFFCEDHRYFDLVRTKHPVPTRYVAGVSQLDPLNERLVSELPQRERNINPALVVRAAK